MEVRCLSRSWAIKLSAVFDIQVSTLKTSCRSFGEYHRPPTNFAFSLSNFSAYPFHRPCPPWNSPVQKVQNISHRALLALACLGFCGSISCNSYLNWSDNVSVQTSPKTLHHHWVLKYLVVAALLCPTMNVVLHWLPSCLFSDFCPQVGAQKWEECQGFNSLSCFRNWINSWTTVTFLFFILFQIHRGLTKQRRHPQTIDCKGYNCKLSRINFHYANSTILLCMSCLL